MKEQISEMISNIVATVLGFMLIGLVVSPTYNAIAWEFNLPTLNYWTICGAMYTINKIRTGATIKKKG